MNEAPEDIAIRVFRFVVSTLQFVKKLPKDQTNIMIIGQLIRCVTSIGANIEEARGGHTKADFAHCMNIAKKESLETRYWLKLLYEMNASYRKELENLLNEIDQIVKILTSIVKTANPRINY